MIDKRKLCRFVGGEYKMGVKGKRYWLSMLRHDPSIPLAAETASRFALHADYCARLARLIQSGQFDA